MKLTLISIVYNGRRLSVFVKLPYIDGKAILCPSTLVTLQNAIGCVSRGVTFTLGG